MTWSQKDSIKVSVLVEVRPLKGQLRVGRRRLAQTANCLKPIRPNIGRHPFHPKESICSVLHFYSDFVSGGKKELFDIAGHQAPLLRIRVCLLERGEIHVSSSQRNTGCVFVLCKLPRVEALDLLEILAEASRVVDGFSKHLGQVDVV